MCGHPCRFVPSCSIVSETATLERDSATTTQRSQLRELVARRLANAPHDVRTTLQVLGELLYDAAVDSSPDDFICDSLGVATRDVVATSRNLNLVFAASVGNALVDWIDTHQPDIGPAEVNARHIWRQISLGDSSVSVPDRVALSFPAGTVSDAPVVVSLREPDYSTDREVSVHTRTADRGEGARVLQDLLDRGRGDRHLYRGRVVKAVVVRGELSFETVEPARTTRDELVIDPAVWAEIDLNITAVSSGAGLMRDLGFPTRRGILLAGPPGVGKTAIDRVIVSELRDRFTVILVDATAGAHFLSAIYEETRNLGPTVIVLEDIDLFIGRRREHDDRALSALLAALDGAASYDEVLTIATTNDPGSLDSAATRSARFDTVIEIGYPTRAAAAKILDSYVAHLPGAGTIDVQAVVRALPDDVSGADLRQVVRRTVLASGARCTTSDFLAAVASGRWRATPLTGSYL